MRKWIRNKFISEVGASLAVALLLFLVCAVVGSVVLAGASASAGRLSQRRQLQQERYALQSAADMIRTQLAGGTKVDPGLGTAVVSGSGQAAGNADADAVNIQYTADLIYNTEDGTAASAMSGSSGTLTIDGTPVSGDAGKSFAVLLLRMENQICQKLWQTDGALKNSWPRVTDESESGSDAKDLGTYVSQSNVRSWTYQPAGSSQDSSLSSGNPFISGVLTIRVDQAEGTTADWTSEVKADIQADENSNLTIRLSVGKYASGQTLVMTLSAQPASIQYNKQRSTENANESSKTDMNVRFAVSWNTLDIRYQAAGASS